MASMTHHDWVREVFDRASQNYGYDGTSYFIDFGERLIEHLCPQQGWSVLDVACGHGAQLVPLAKALGKEGELFGVDLSQKMLEKAKDELAKHHLQATLLQMDAERLDFADESFDALTCGSALYFFSDPQKALREFFRVLKRGGVLALSLFAKSDPRYSWLSERGKSLGASKNVIVQRFKESEQLQRVIQEAGFEKTQIIEEVVNIHFRDLEYWWQSLWSNATRAMLEQLTPPHLQQLKEEAFDKMRPSLTDRGLTLQFSFYYVLAEKTQA